MGVRSRWPVLLLAALAVISGCGSDSTPTGASSAASSSTRRPAAALSDTAWNLTSYRGPGGNSVPAASGGTATLRFQANGDLAGSTGCNQFGGRYRVAGRTLTIEVGPMTQIACVDPLVMAQESAVVTGLPKVATFEMTDTTLTLQAADGSPLFVYTAGLSSLEGTTWRATGVNNGNGGVVSSALTEKLTATFAAGGGFSGFGGCNQLGGQYETGGTDGLTITDVTSTRKACGAEVDALEAQYVTALTNVATYAIDGDTLTLRDRGGATQVTFTVTR